MRILIATGAVLFMLAACGGGGGSPETPLSTGNSGAPPPQPPASPSDRNCASVQGGVCVDFTARPAFPWNNLGNPLWIHKPGPSGAIWDRNQYNEHDGNTVVLGPGVYGLELLDLADLEEAGAHGAYALHYERVNDGAGASVLTGLLTTDGAGAPSPVKRWGPVPPTVHVAAGTTAAQVAELRLVVNYLNSALPPGWQLRWSDERFDVPAGDGASLDGRIEVVFAPAGAWPEAGHETLGLTRRHFDAGGEIHSARVWVDPDAGFNRYTPVRQKVIAHELLHALGRDHADSGRFRETILHQDVGEVPAIAPVLRQLDNEALLAVYGFLDAGQTAGGVSQALGSWETASNHVAATLAFGDAGRLGFGASERNGLVRPWAVGTPVPEALLSVNGSPDGSASWSGRLVGLTPFSEPVAGDVTMTVNLDPGGPGGRLEFRNLEIWAANAAPGAIGSGERWGDGALDYTIAMTDNGFRQAAASRDEGEIEGHLLGAGHEAMVGVLQRRDLSAGFGGARRQE